MTDDQIEIVAFMTTAGLITNQKKHWPSACKLITRQVFEFMESCDLWRNYGFATAPPLLVLTKEQWKKAHSEGIMHG